MNNYLSERYLDGRRSILQEQRREWLAEARLNRKWIVWTNSGYWEVASKTKAKWVVNRGARQTAFERERAGEPIMVVGDGQNQPKPWNHGWAFINRRITRRLMGRSIFVGDPITAGVVEQLGMRVESPGSRTLVGFQRRLAEVNRALEFAGVIAPQALVQPSKTKGLEL